MPIPKKNFHKENEKKTTKNIKWENESEKVYHPLSTISKSKKMKNNALFIIYLTVKKKAINYMKLIGSLHLPHLV